VEFIKKLYDEQEYYNLVRNTIIYVAVQINDFDLDDCISEVYKTALEFENLEKHPNIHGWLAVTAKNIAKRYKQNQFLEGARFSEEDIDSLKPENENKKREYDEQCNELLKILEKKLKRADYRLFKLRFVEHRSMEEIADEIGIKKHSAEVRITRLKEKVKNVLEV